MTTPMQTVLVLAASGLFSNVQTQSCIGNPPLQPLVPCATQLKALCLCANNPYGGNCHWQWSCPQASSSASQPVAQPDNTIPLSYHPTITPNDPAELMRRAQEMREMQQQTELLRLQTEALRRQTNPVTDSPAPSDWSEWSSRQQTKNVLDTWAQQPLQAAYLAMPNPSGNEGRDKRNWEKWRAKLDAPVRALVPTWSLAAYEQMRAIVFGK